MAENLSDLERWNGSFPGEHAFSDLEGLEQDAQNPGMADFLEAAHTLTEKWEGNKFAGLYVYGTPGVGKTHAAVGLGRALHDSGADIFYRYAPAVAEVRNTAYWSGYRFSDVKYDRNGIFATQLNPGTARNPKTVLILDDYRPEAQTPLHDAVEAAAQFGGLVVVTSNYTDPFKLLETPDQTAETDILKDAVLTQVAPEVATRISARREKAAEAISDSLRGRIASGFKLIEFGGEDRRLQNSFWR